MRKILYLLGSISLLLSSPILQANIVLQNHALNACEHISGYWEGSGKASHWMIGECLYHGSGLVSSVDHNGALSAELIVEKDSGSFLCPARVKKHLKGSCNNSNVSIITPYGDLIGIFSENQGHSHGKLKISSGINVNVSIHFSRLQQ